MRTFTHALAVVLLPVFSLPALAQSAHPLNDTGQTQCYYADEDLTPDDIHDDPSYEAVACDEAGTGDSAPHPRQDARFGRDAQATDGTLTKQGGGAAGFDFTALGASGDPVAPGGHACVRDNVTGLIWSAETSSDNINWAAAMAAASPYSRCGHATGWRVPTRRELLSIVHRGTTSSPAIDGDYFPGTDPAGLYWTSDEEMSSPGYAAWTVYFQDGSAYGANKAGSIGTYRVRLVHGGQ